MMVTVRTEKITSDIITYIISDIITHIIIDIITHIIADIIKHTIDDEMLASSPNRYNYKATAFTCNSS
jgi:hypothetical protein